MQQQQAPQAAHAIDRDQAKELEAEVERRRKQEIAQREYEREIGLREREQREQRDQREQREQHQSPLENHAVSIPIQQPVASRIPATLHGPNGILNHQHIGAAGGQAPPSAPLGAPSGPGNVFANGLPAARDGSPRPFVQQGPQMIPAQQLLNPGGVGPAQQLPAGLAQGAQQPILNVSHLLFLVFLTRSGSRFSLHQSTPPSTSVNIFTKNFGTISNGGHGPEKNKSPNAITCDEANSRAGCSELSRPGESSLRRSSGCLQSVSGYHERFQKPGV